MKEVQLLIFSKDRSLLFLKQPNNHGRVNYILPTSDLPSDRSDAQSIRLAVESKLTDLFSEADLPGSLFSEYRSSRHPDKQIYYYLIQLPALSKNFNTEDFDAIPIDRLAKHVIFADTLEEATTINILRLLNSGELRYLNSY